MGLFETLAGTVKGLTGGVQTEQKGLAYPATLTVADLWDSDLETDTVNHEIACTHGNFIKIAQYQVPAQTKLALGRGRLGSPTEEKGYIYMITYDDTGTPVEEPGMYRFYAEDIHGNKELLAEFRSEELKAGGSDFDRTKAQLLTESDVLIREDSYLAIYFNPDATDEVQTHTSSKWLVPVTKYKC